MMQVDTRTGEPSFRSHPEWSHRVVGRFLTGDAGGGADGACWVGRVPQEGGASGGGVAGGAWWGGRVPRGGGARGGGVAGCRGVSWGSGGGSAGGVIRGGK